MAALISPRVLSIQSHVVYGYVGNKAACFPLQRLGFECDTINAVQFSNHTGYPTFNGTTMDGEQLLQLIQGLEDNGLAGQYSHVLSGYIGSLSVLEAIASVVERLRAHNPGLIYLCDPVQGDDGRLYCKPELPAAFRDIIIPLASIITPNQMEIELLTGRKITSVADALQACQMLHERGPHTVIITSASLPGWEKHVTVIASTTKQQDDGSSNHLLLRVPKLEAYFTGTGDLLSSLLLAWMHRHPNHLKNALELALAGLQAILHETAQHMETVLTSSPRSNDNKHTGHTPAEICRARELRLIQNQDLLVQPQVVYRAEAILDVDS